MRDLRLGKWQDVLKGEMCDALICDPPFSAVTHKNQRTGSSLESSTIHYDPINESYCDVFVRAWAQKIGTWAIVFSDDVGFQWWRNAFSSAGFVTFAPVAYLRANPAPRFSGDGPTSALDYICVARKKGKLPAKRHGSRPGYYIDRGQERTGHPGSKALSVMRAIVRDYTLRGDRIIDPFAGSGTTLIAADVEGRSCTGAECDPDTHALAMRRFKAGTTGDLFAEAEG